MGEPNVALGVYMNDPARIRSVLEYYLGEKLPEDWKYEQLKGLYPVRDSKGKLTYRQRDLIGKACAWGTHFLLGLENQEKVNLIFPWRLMEMDCLAYRQEIEAACEKNQFSVPLQEGRPSKAGAEPDAVLGKEKVGEAVVSSRDGGGCFSIAAEITAAGGSL